jgi:hypothetical protein
MKTNSAFIVLVIIVFCSCTSPGYLPSYSDIDINEHGSYIKIFRKSTSNIEGELIAIDNNTIYVLTEHEKCITISVSDVNNFKLRYARQKHYGWTIPAFLIYPLIHGGYSLYTMPIHLIVTITATVGGENAFTYSDKNMSFDKLKMFARFPQGIPNHIDLASIK